MTTPAAAVANPYPGLRPFEESDADRFFGRESQVEELLARLEDGRFLAVVGLSGSGKSSLVKAGLVPALRRGEIATGGEDWRIVVARPGMSPMANLARALGAQGLRPDSGQTLETLKASSFGLIHASGGRRRYENLLLCVDQFEEIFRHNVSEETSEFVRLLLAAAAASDPDYPIWVVLTMRSDYVGECVQFADLPEALNQGQYLVPRLSREQRLAAIEEPARRRGAKFEPALLFQLLADAGDDPYQLPRLQHLLMRMWDRRGMDAGQAPVTMDHYRDSGSWTGALDKHSEEVLAGIPERLHPAVRSVFQRLTEPGEHKAAVRRLARFGELVEASRAPEADVAAIVQRFRDQDCNFLTAPDVKLVAASTVDITHESLIQLWTRLNVWVREEARVVETLRKAEAAAAEWVAKGRSEGYLWSADQLADASTRLGLETSRLTADGAAFLDASRELQARNESRAWLQQRVDEWERAGRGFWKTIPKADLERASGMVAEDRRRAIPCLTETQIRFVRTSARAERARRFAGMAAIVLVCAVVLAGTQWTYELARQKAVHTEELKKVEQRAIGAETQKTRVLASQRELLDGALKTAWTYNQKAGITFEQAAEATRQLSAVEPDPSIQNITIWYYRKPQEASMVNDLLVPAWQSLGFKVIVKPMFYSGTTNTIWMGKNVPPAAFRAVAYTLIGAGFPLKQICNSRDDPGKAGVIQVGSWVRAVSLPSLLVDQVKSLPYFCPARGAGSADASEQMRP